MLNPKKYDPAELRALTGATPPPRATEPPRWATPEDFLAPAEARVRSVQLGDAVLAGRASGGATRPYLPRLPDTEAATRVARDWLDFLVGVGGTGGARNALAFYRRVDWLGAEAADALSAHLETFAHADERPLDAGHHRTSLLFVARLAALR